MRARGFTLVEVMVALAIVAIALPALLMSLYQQIDDTGYLRDKTLAHMVAENKLAEMRLVVGSTRNLSAGKDSGFSEMADREWYWWLETKTTEVGNFFRVDIKVALEEEQREQPLYTLTAFMSGDLAIDAEGLTGSEGNSDSDSDRDSGDNGSPTDVDANEGTDALPDAATPPELSPDA